MPIGYTVGKQYRLDRNYDRYAALSVWKRILREASNRKFSLEIKYSHVGRNYSAEVFQMMTFKHSAHVYNVSSILKHGRNPLEAMVIALRAALDKEGIGCDPLMSMLFLEAEVMLLGMAWQDAKDRQAKETELVEKALKVLRIVLDTIPAAPDEDDDL